MNPATAETNRYTPVELSMNKSLTKGRQKLHRKGISQSISQKTPTRTGITANLYSEDNYG